MAENNIFYITCFQQQQLIKESNKNVSITIVIVKKVFIGNTEKNNNRLSRSITLIFIILRNACSIQHICMVIVYRFTHWNNIKVPRNG